jgi:di/tricarboxylate transporter
MPGPDAAIVFTIVAAAFVFFLWGRWRYDVVALGALLVAALSGVVPPEEAFLGFGHPAVITVAAVLVVSRGLMNAGLVDRITRAVSFVPARPTLQIAVLMALVTVLSSVLSSVAAAALFVPVAKRMARRTGTQLSTLLMPIAFASLLGAQLTAIGSAPNIIIATFRGENGESPFRMFDFTPVGGAVAVAGILLISLVGWRLIPERKGRTSAAELIELAGYMSEVRVPEDSRLVGKTVGDIEKLGDGELTVIGLVRGRRRLPPPAPSEEIKAKDVLIVEADSELLAKVTSDLGLELVGAGKPDEQANQREDIEVMEVTVPSSSTLLGKTANSVRLRWRYGVSLLAVSRGGEPFRNRLGRNRLRAGDVLLLQGPEEQLHEAVAATRLLPLAHRDLRLGRRRQLIAAAAIFGGALVATATGAIRLELAFATAAILMVAGSILSLSEAYESIDGSIVILLGAMIPVGQALETSGGAESLANQVLRLSGLLPPTATVALVLVATMFLSDVVNNAAAAVLMAPIAVGVAEGLGASADPFLMAVAVGASCAFLTPIGHQSNTLVLGPGGYRFGDFWRLGLPLEVCVVAVATPMIVRVWPL